VPVNARSDREPSVRGADPESINQRIYRAGAGLHTLKAEVRAFIDAGDACTAIEVPDGERVVFTVSSC
jgi:hypothetical protein